MIGARIGLSSRKSRLGVIVVMLGGTLGFAAHAIANDTGTCNGQLATIDASDADGPLAIQGTGNADIIVGTDKDDKIYGLGGGDTICAGKGDDEVIGGDGEDYIFGQKGDDNLGGSGDSDFVDGGKGDDIVQGGGGSDILNGGDGDDLVVGTDDNSGDELNGDDGEDVCPLGAGDEPDDCES